MTPDSETPLMNSTEVVAHDLASSDAVHLETSMTESGDVSSAYVTMVFMVPKSTHITEPAKATSTTRSIRCPP